MASDPDWRELLQAQRQGLCDDLAAAADTPAPTRRDLADLLDIEVDQLAGMITFVAANHLPGWPVHPRQPVQTVALQDLPHRRRGRPRYATRSSPDPTSWSGADDTLASPRNERSELDIYAAATNDPRARRRPRSTSDATTCPQLLATGPSGPRHEPEVCRRRPVRPGSGGQQE